MTMKRTLTPIFLFALSTGAVAAAAACSEATDGLVPMPTSGDGAAVDETTADGAPADPDRTSDAARPTFDAATTSRSVVLLNEVSGSGEWIEIVNAGTSAVDISGWKVADTDKDTGGPKVGEAAVFLAGTVLSPRAYALVKGGGVDAGKPCPNGDQSYCVFAEFGISNKNGETIFLLDPKDAVLGSVVFPPNDAGKDTSLSRVPSGVPDAGFVNRPESPGAKNPD